MSKKLSRRDFLKNAAAASAGFAALGLFGQSAKAEDGDKYTMTFKNGRTASGTVTKGTNQFRHNRLTVCPRSIHLIDKHKNR